MLIGESRQPIGLAAFLPLGRRLPLRLLIFYCCDLPTVGSRLWGLTFVVVLLLSLTGVSSRSSGSLGSHFASRVDLNLRLHRTVGRGVLIRYD